MGWVETGHRERVSASRQSSLSFRKSEGRVVLRSRIARDLATILDVDPSVELWVSVWGRGNPPDIQAPDFRVRLRNGVEFFADSPDRAATSCTRRLALQLAEDAYRLYTIDEIHGGPRLQNSRELLRYSHYAPSLADRIRLLSGLEEHGSLTLAECMPAFEEGKPIPSLAVLHMLGWIEIDLDSELIGPDTRIRRFRV